jgi:acetyltransferase-like isoleucine patch superfamily enzyme
MAHCTGEQESRIVMPRESRGYIIGKLPETVHKNEYYFMSRDMIVDCRGYLEIHEDAHFGRGVKIITQAHTAVGSKTWSEQGVRVSVVVEKNAFVNAYAILYNTRIGEGAIVSAGCVVLGRNVAPYVIVAGNPAEVIARWNEDDQCWNYVREYFGKLE